MKVGDLVALEPKTLKGKNLLQNRGARADVVRIEGAAAYLHFARRPETPTKAVEETIAAWEVKESPELHAWIREYCYASEYDLWVPLVSQDFDFGVLGED